MWRWPHEVPEGLGCTFWVLVMLGVYALVVAVVALVWLI
jgi:hypothetical protein